MRRLAAQGGILCRYAASVCSAFVFAAGFAPLLAQAQSAHLYLVTEQLPPLNMSDDNGKTLRGIATERIQEVMRRAGIDYKMELMAWNRALELGKRQADTCVFSTVRTPEREAIFKWLGPIAKGEWVMFGLADKQGKVTALEQVKGAHIGGYLGDAAAHYMEDLGYPVVESYSDDVTLKNLLAGRLDYWVSSRRAANAIIADAHAEGRVVPLFHVKSVEYYLACNTQVGEDVMNGLRAALKQMMGDGSFDKVEAKYASDRN
ncbi:MAG TPA: transporter substrate-binding domain-containing protein [Burkholderiaceae bacterium]